MTHAQERRDKRRIIVGPDHTVRFLAGGHAFRNVPLTNLSLGGCFATLGNRDSGLFTQGTVLEQFAFEHPDLAGPFFTARVAFVLGGGEPSALLRFLGLGIELLDVPPATRERLEVLITLMLGPERA